MSLLLALAMLRHWLLKCHKPNKKLNHIQTRARYDRDLWSIHIYAPQFCGGWTSNGTWIRWIVSCHGPSSNRCLRIYVCLLAEMICFSKLVHMLSVRRNGASNWSPARITSTSRRTFKLHARRFRYIIANISCRACTDSHITPLNMWTRGAMCNNISDSAKSFANAS